MKQVLMKISALTAFILTLTVLVSPFSVSATIQTEEPSKIYKQDQNDSGTSEEYEAIALIRENLALLEEAALLDDELNQALSRYNSQDREKAFLMAFQEISQKNAIQSNQLQFFSNDLQIQGDITPQAIPILIWAIVAAIIKAAIKKKMGPKIVKLIGDQFDTQIWPKMEPGLKKQFDRHGYKGSKGPESSGSPNNISQGQHIIDLYDRNDRLYVKIHVNKNQSGNSTSWHWHEMDNPKGSDWHVGNFELKHNTLPKWGAPD
ncbi:YpjP family protein [Saccharibacillus sacchari]|uniref:YpjP family protein n=1 Tax=Saccharibacillus sacchari TaxID=456493 RepID=UPI00068460C4|nr:YpjP family protein [Saccharibacillus sacchari]